MAKKIPSENIADIEMSPITKGMILEDVVSYKASPDEALTWLENASDDSLGYITTRRQFKKRTPASGASISSPIRAIVTNGLSGGGNLMLYYQQGRDLIKFNLISSGSATVFSNFFTNSNKNRFDIFAKTLLMTNDSSGTSAVYYQAGDAASPTALDTKFPNTVNIISAGFVGRVWGASSSQPIPTLYYSDVIPSGGITALTTASTNSVAINLKGEGPTALVQTPNILYVFSDNYILRVNNTNSIENAPHYMVGTPSQESVVKCSDSYYFYHYSGIYSLSQSGGLNKISNQIYYLLKKVKIENKDNVFGWSQDIFVYFYLGNLTGYPSNKYYTVRYNIMNDSWSIITTTEALVLATSGDMINISSSDAAVGTLEEWNPPNIIMTATSMATLDIFDPAADDESTYGDFKDSGSPTQNIAIDVQTKWITFDIEGHWKRINGIAVPHINAAGINLAYQTDTDDPDRWIPVGALDEKSVTLFRDFQTKAFNRIKFRYYGESYGARMKFAMPIFLQVDDLGYNHG